MEMKKKLREHVRRCLSSHDWRLRKQRSRIIADKLFHLGVFQKAKTVCFYVSLPSEVDTKPMIDRALAEGKRVAVPRSEVGSSRLDLFKIAGRGGLHKGLLGILEPPGGKGNEVNPRELDCVIVPGVAFDRAHHRMGRGRGFYDRFLEKLPGHVYKIGLAFSFQVFPEIPKEPHDVKLDLVLTD